MTVVARTDRLKLVASAVYPVSGPAILNGAVLIDEHGRIAAVGPAADVPQPDGVQMQRIKIPMGVLTTDQMIGLANLAEEYAVGVAHITTRQDIQYHYIDINDTPNLMRRLAEVGITTKEACGNVVRNVTACPQAGVCSDETFDVTPYARAMTYFLLRHPDAQSFGRKFKIAYSGCEDNGCGLARMHDIGAIAKVKEVDGKQVQGFQVFVGGGLGALPFQAKLYSDFLPAEELMPLAQAISRVFARLGEKQNRAKARMKFLIAKLGFDEFKRQVEEEITKLPHDPQWQARMDEALTGYHDQPLNDPSELQLPDDASPELLRWLDVNVRPQAQQGYSMVEVFLPFAQNPATGETIFKQFTGDNFALLTHDDGGKT